MGVLGYLCKEEKINKDTLQLIYRNFLAIYSNKPIIDFGKSIFFRVEQKRRALNSLTIYRGVFNALLVSFKTRDLESDLRIYYSVLQDDNVKIELCSGGAYVRFNSCVNDKKKQELAEVFRSFGFKVFPGKNDDLVVKAPKDKNTFFQQAAHAFDGCFGAVGPQKSAHQPLLIRR